METARRLRGAAAIVRAGAGSAAADAAGPGRLLRARLFPAGSFSVPRVGAYDAIPLPPNRPAGFSSIATSNAARARASVRQIASVS